LQVTFVMSAANRKHTRPLLEKFGMPFEKEGGKR
jgi:ribosomal protein L5